MSRIEYVEIERVIRRRSSKNGNPRWDIVCKGGAIQTTDVDAQVGYCISDGDCGLFKFTYSASGHYLQSIERVRGNGNS